MSKLTEREREGFEKILAEDLKAINAKFMNQIKDFWERGDFIEQWCQNSFSLKRLMRLECSQKILANSHFDGL